MWSSSSSGTHSPSKSNEHVVCIVGWTVAGLRLHEPSAEKGRENRNNSTDISTNFEELHKSIQPNYLINSKKIFFPKPICFLASIIKFIWTTRYSERNTPQPNHSIKKIINNNPAKTPV